MFKLVKDLKEIVDSTITRRFIGLISSISFLLFVMVLSEFMLVIDIQEREQLRYRDTVKAILGLKADQLSSWRYERLRDIEYISKILTDEPFLSYVSLPTNYVYKDLVEMKLSSLFTDNIFTDITILNENFEQLGVVRTKYEFYSALIETYKKSNPDELDTPNIVDLSQEIDGSVHMAVGYYTLINNEKIHILFIIKPEYHLYKLLRDVPLITSGDNLYPVLFRLDADSSTIFTSYSKNIPIFSRYKYVDYPSNHIVQSSMEILNKNIKSDTKEVLDDKSIPSISSFTMVKSSPWYLSVLIPQKDGYASIKKQGVLNKIVLISILVLWVLTVFTLWTKRKLVQASNVNMELEQYKVLVENSPDVIYERSSIRGYIFYSPIIKDVLGYSPKQLLKNDFTLENLVHPDDIDFVRLSYIQALETNLLNIDYRVLDAMGNWLWLSDRSISIGLGVGDSEFIINGVLTNITERKKLEDVLKLSASIFSNASESMVITDPKGVVIDINDSFSRVTGYSREEVIGNKLNILKSGLQTTEFYTEMFDTLLKQGNWHGELWNKRKDGRLYLEDLSITALRDLQGNISNYIGLFFSKKLKT